MTGGRLSGITSLWTRLEAQEKTNMVKVIASKILAVVVMLLKITVDEEESKLNQINHVPTYAD